MKSSVALPEAEQASKTHPFLAGWGRATMGAVATALVAGAVAVLATLLLRAGHPLQGTSLVDTLRHGWALFYLFHHVGIEVISPEFHLPASAEQVAGVPSGYDVDATIAFAPMAGTILVLWFLYRAGRATGAAVGGEPLERGLHGAKVAIPYALLSYVSSWFLHTRLDLPGASPMSIHPSHIASLFWPLALGAAAGLVGGIRSGSVAIWDSDWWETDRWNRRWRGAVAGGWRMLWLPLSLSLIALVGLAVARPSDSASYLEAIASQGALGAVALAFLTALVLPNMALWILVPAMGGCLEVGGDTSHPFCFLGYGAFPGHQLGGPPTNPAGFPNLGPAPPVFLLFALIPVAAVIAGGMLAARRGDARSAGDGAIIGALGGAVFALLMVPLVFLSSVTAVFNGPIYYVATGVFRYGAHALPAFWLSLAWGVLGGAAGGWLEHRRRRRRPSA